MSHAEDWFGHSWPRCSISFEAGIKAEQARIIKLLEPFIQKALMHEVTINDARGLLAALEGKND